MYDSHKGLLINGRYFTTDELSAFSREKVMIPHIPLWEKEVYEFILDWLSEKEFIVQHTSGTTGKSREIKLLKSSMIRSAENTCSFLNLIKGQSALLCLPIRYIAGKMIVIRCLTGSLDLRLIEPQISLDLTGLESIDFSAMVPLQAWNALNTSAYHFPIRKLIIGGAEISAELEDLTSNLTTEVFASYGMAETCSHVALRRLNGSGAQSDYHALPEVTLTRDKRGCLVISSTYLPDQIVTNDLVEFTGNGTFKWVGRVDNLINSAGVKIVPEEMEAAIMTKTGLRCTVVGIPDTRLGKKLILAVEKQDEKSMVTDLELCIRELFPKHKWPKRIIYLERFPRNSSFKVDRHELTRMVSGMI